MLSAFARRRIRDMTSRDKDDFLFDSGIGPPRFQNRWVGLQGDGGASTLNAHSLPRHGYLLVF
jgi:hypothetical protein